MTESGNNIILFETNVRKRPCAQKAEAGMVVYINLHTLLEICQGGILKQSAKKPSWGQMQVIFFNEFLHESKEFCKNRYKPVLGTNHRKIHSCLLIAAAIICKKTERVPSHDILSNKRRAPGMFENSRSTKFTEIHSTACSSSKP